MRKIKMLNRVSIDGYFASNNEENFGMDWFIHDPEVDEASHVITGKMETLLLGGTTYRGFERSWVPFLQDPHAPQELKKVAAELKANSGAAVVVSGSNDVNVQIVVNTINNAIGAYGKTIDWGTTLNYRQGIDGDMNKLVADMETGTVGALLIHGANPVYDYFDAAKFKAALSKVKGGKLPGSNLILGSTSTFFFSRGGSTLVTTTGLAGTATLRSGAAIARSINTGSSRTILRCCVSTSLLSTSGSAFLGSLITSK